MIRSLSTSLTYNEMSRLRDMAQEAGVDVDRIVGGIVKLYLQGKVRGGSPSPAPDKLQKLTGAFLEAVREYEDSTAQPAPKTRSRGRGRPPALTQEQVTFARELKKKGHSYPDIGARLGVGKWVVRDALTRNLSSRV